MNPNSMDSYRIDRDASHWLLDAALGRQGWWEQIQAMGAPLQEALWVGGPVGTAGERVRVTFLWRDPEGTEASSSTVKVYVDVNSVTDHHSFDPQSLQRVPGTDVWFWQVDLPAHWRGSYRFIPVCKQQLPPALLQQQDANPAVQQQAQRTWWRSVESCAIADPLNPHCHRNTWGAYSALHLPKAPDQSAWIDTHRLEMQLLPTRLVRWKWHAELTGLARTVWLFSTGRAADLPLVILLDGQRWAQEMPIFKALEFDTLRGRLPAAHYLLIDSVDPAQRNQDLSCNDRFWQALTRELLVEVANQYRIELKSSRTLLAGQSLGGLAAIYGALQWPQYFGAVLSQSGSFWWPYVEWLQAPPGQPCERRPGARGWLAEQLAAGKMPAPPLRIVMEVGSREDVMIDVNVSLREQLVAGGHQVHFQLFEGGHDAVCWRGGLLDGLAFLFSQQAGSNQNKES